MGDFVKQSHILMEILFVVGFIVAVLFVIGLFFIVDMIQQRNIFKAQKEERERLYKGKR